MTTTELLRAESHELASDIADLLARSAIRHESPFSRNVVWVGPTGVWGELDTAGRRLQSKVLDAYRRHHSILSTLLSGQASDAAIEFEEADAAIREIVDQSSGTWFKSVDEAKQKTHEALALQIALVERLHDAGDGQDIYVPDTNALLFHPDLDHWTFPESRSFELVLPPTVLVELDELKVNHRNEDVRDRAEGLIRRLKGYRERGGPLTDGVTLRSGVSTIRSLGVEPRMDRSLPWLDPGNRDDRLIASVFELMRTRPRSATRIVTRDINLQNKAEIALIPFCEPPISG